MKVPHTIVFLGFAYELVWTTDGGRPRISLFRLKKGFRDSAGDVRGLFANPSGSAIFVLPYKRVSIEPVARARTQAGRLSSRWAGYEADILLRFNLPDQLARLDLVGQLEKVEYTSDKLERSGDTKGRFALYTHTYKRPLDLYADRLDKPRVFGAKLANKKIVTSRGLIG